MIDFYLCKMLFRGDKNSMSAHQIQQIHSAKRSKMFKTTHFILGTFFNKKCFDFSLENWLSFKIWEERIFKNFSVDPFFIIILMAHMFWPTPAQNQNNLQLFQPKLST